MCVCASVSGYTHNARACIYYYYYYYYYFYYYCFTAPGVRSYPGELVPER